MGTTVQAVPTSQLRVGFGRADTTPPVGIYHRMWGAARHDRASGVHRPLVGDVLAFGALAGSGVELIRAYLDGVGLAQREHDDLVRILAEAGGVSTDRVVVSYSHTHSGGVFYPDRIPLPGGKLIPAYLAQLGERLATACRQAVATLQPVVISYATGRCDLAANRDNWDEAFNGHVCGFNPDAPADDTVVVARLTDAAGKLFATLVNYACHPTTLAWDNSLISPDYVGAMRDVVETASSAPCIFAQGASGDLGPRHGFVGDTAIADKNGRQLGYAALSALQTLEPPLADFQYSGPVISGATIGVWANVPFDATRQAATSHFSGGSYLVELPLKPRPEPAALRTEIAQWEARQKDADARGDAIAARDFGARAERARRWLGRLAALPAGPTFPFPYWVYRLGDAVWVTTGGEPYNLLQTSLRQRFPERTIVVSPLAGAGAAAYLLPRDRYGKGLYQEEPSSLAPGCLEMLIETIGERIADLG